MRAAPGVEQRRGDVGRPALAQGHPRQHRHCRIDAGLAPGGSFGGAGRPGGQDHRAGAPGRWRQVAVRSRGDQGLEGRGVVLWRARARGVDRAVGPRQDPVGRLGPGEQPGELLVVDDGLRLLAGQHVGQLRAGERGVEVEHVGSELGDCRTRVDEPAVVAAHHRHPVTLADAPGPEGAGKGVAAAVELAEGQRAQLVDQSGAVGVADRQGDETSGRPDAPRTHDRREPRHLRRRVGADDAGLRQHPEPRSVRRQPRWTGAARGGSLRLLERSMRGLGCHQPRCRPVLADRRCGGLRQPGDRSRLGDVGRVDGVGPAHLGCQQPDRAATHQVGQ